MSHLFRLLRPNLFMRGRSTILMNNISELPPTKNISLTHHQPKLTLTTPPRSTEGTDKEKQEKQGFQDNFKYTVRFADNDFKKIFKDFYSLYGPLFIGCHISVSLFSLGFFYSVVWLTVDPIQYIPEALATRLGDVMLSMTGSGGKFVLAYAIHKLILPVRLGAAIWVTRTLARKIKLKKSPMKEKSN